MIKRGQRAGKNSCTYRKEESGIGRELVYEAL
jgi:hypothetical protein